MFLRGAGVSRPAGMPDFPGLARYVGEEMGTAEDAPPRVMLSRWDNENVPTETRPPLDSIFNLLQQEYGASEIEALIAGRRGSRPVVPPGRRAVTRQGAEQPRTHVPHLYWLGLAGQLPVPLLSSEQQLDVSLAQRRGALGA